MDKDAQSVTGELKDCPFCAGDACLREYDEEHPFEPFGLVVDHKEDCFLHYLRLLDDAVTAWNTRASQPTSEDAWRPIETFVDGEEYEDGILICDATKPSPSVGVARFLGDKWMGFDQSFGVECFYPTPTHWMPLPAAPEQS